MSAARSSAERGGGPGGEPGAREGTRGGAAPGARRVRLEIEYDGTGFHGWQLQARTGERTVQGALQEAFARLPGEHGPVIGAGRTDAGVHALAMVAHCDTSTTVPDARLRLALDAHLPRDVAVLGVRAAPPDFESQFDCRYRRYLYRMRAVRDRPRGLALDRCRVLPILHRVDAAAMAAAARRFEGARDFASLATQETRSTVRTVHLCELREEAGELRLHIAGDGFLRGMVRAVVGTLLQVGKGRWRPEDVDAILAARDRRRAGPNAGPQGLYFAEAGYEPWDAAASEAALARRLE